MNAWILAAVLSAASSEGGNWTVFFQENCLPCRKQLRELDCLKTQGWNIKVVGIGESRIHLRHELLRSTQSRYPIEFKSWDEARDLGIFGTPYHHRKNKEGRLERFHGLVSCKSL